MSMRLGRVVLLSAVAGTGLAAGAVIATAAHAATMATVFVAPSGDDANDGSAAPRPVLTPGRAQQLVRGLTAHQTGDIRVELASGTYRLTDPLQLDARDSGTGGFRVTWTAASGARPVLSGGVPVTGWNRVDAAQNMWVAPVSPRLI